MMGEILNIIKNYRNSKYYKIFYNSKYFYEITINYFHYKFDFSQKYNSNTSNLADKFMCNKNIY
jgi:hypothetical protein